MIHYSMPAHVSILSHAHTVGLQARQTRITIITYVLVNIGVEQYFEVTVFAIFVYKINVHLVMTDEYFMPNETIYNVQLCMMIITVKQRVQCYNTGVRPSVFCQGSVSHWH